jgi:hypothetical protein
MVYFLKEGCGIYKSLCVLCASVAKKQTENKPKQAENI